MGSFPKQDFKRILMFYSVLSKHSFGQRFGLRLKNSRDFSCSTRLSNGLAWQQDRQQLSKMTRIALVQRTGLEDRQRPGTEIQT